MKGFDKEFRDLPHYICAITERIWEGRQVGDIRKYYSRNCPVRSPTGLVKGADAVVSATLATLAEFPDRLLLGEDVVWKGDAKAGFLSSHRILSLATHAGNGAFGEATNRRLRYRIIADCLVRDNQVREEWLVRDQGAIAMCLGMTAREMAQAQIDKGDKGFFTPAKDVRGAYRVKFSKDKDALAYLKLWRDLWEGADLSSVSRMYDTAATLFAPGGVDYSGHAEIDKFHLGYLASFDNAVFQACDLTATENERGKTIALRWEITGKNSGRGIFSCESKGAPVYMMGISHARFASGKILQEWALTDEVAVWKQILG